MKKVLVFGLSSNMGGVETVFKTFYENINKNDYHFDFVARDGRIALQEEYKRDGSKVFVVSNFLAHPIKYYNAIKQIMKSNHYDIVHINILSDANMLPLVAAKRAKIQNIVIHSHNNNTCGIVRKLLHLINKPFFIKSKATKIACSNSAGHYTFGKSYLVINNPFEPRKFEFSIEKRASIREKYNIPDDCILLGTVGRLAQQKNPLFLVDVLDELKKNQNKDIRLMYIGDGKLKNKIIRRASRKNIIDKIVFVENTKDIVAYYSAFDIFVMPSKYEGLGMVALEAQASGLPCIFSEYVPSDVNITGANRLELNSSTWAKHISSHVNTISNRSVNFNNFKPFDSNNSAKLLLNAYNKNSIDFVIMWVDPNDPKWQKDKAKFTPASNTDSSNRRYRDWDNLQYWFRGVEKYAPWVNNIYFVTYGHIPKWLNINHPKLRIVKHSDFIPKEYLPTFSANPIELNLHRIDGLSENFVFFNDDFFLINPTKPSDFFKKGSPCDAACMYANIPSGNVVDSLFINDMAIINKHFSIRKVLKKNPFKWYNTKNGKYLYNNLTMSVYGGFVGLHFSHLPASFRKTTYMELWKQEHEKLDKTCRNRFRSTEDVNQWLIKYWQLCKGDFTPRSVNWGKYYEYNMGNGALETIFNSKKYKATCLNDTISDSDFEYAKTLTNKLFKKKFPNKSKFER